MHPSRGFARPEEPPVAHMPAAADAAPTGSRRA
jgi:hypothetical protein